MEYDVTEYPAGYDRVEQEELVFLPQDPEVRDAFMTDMLQWLVQW